MCTALDGGNAATPVQPEPPQHPPAENPSPPLNGAPRSQAPPAHTAPSAATPSPLAKLQGPPVPTTSTSKHIPPQTPHPAPTPPPASLLPRLAFPDPATERAFRSYAAIHRPISDAAAALIVLFAIFPSVGIRAVTLHVCPCLSDRSHTLCQFPPYAAPASVRQLLRSFPCNGTWPQQSAWWARHWPRASYLVLFRPSVLEFGWLFAGMVALLLVTPVARASWYHRLRLAVVLAMRVGGFVVSAAVVLVVKRVEQPSFVDVHFSRYTMWGATALMWHCLMHAVPFDVHVRLAPLELVAVAICVFARNPHLLTPPSAAPILFYQLGIGLLLPTCVLYIMEVSQRRQSLSRQNRLQRLQSPSCSLHGWAGVVGASEPGMQGGSVEPCEAPAACSGCAVPGLCGFLANDAQQPQKQQQECHAIGKPASQNGVADLQCDVAEAAAAKQAALAPADAAVSGPGATTLAEPAAGVLLGKVSRKPGGLDSLYRPCASCLLVSVKIPHPPASVEQDPSGLVHAVHASALHTIGKAAGGTQAMPVLRMQHTAIKGCIQLLLWIHTGAPAPQQEGAATPGSSPPSGGGLSEAGSGGEAAAVTGQLPGQLPSQLQSELEAAAVAAAVEVCAAADTARQGAGAAEMEAVGSAGGVGSVGGKAASSGGAAAAQVFVSSMQLCGATRDASGMEGMEGGSGGLAQHGLEGLGGKQEGGGESFQGDGRGNGEKAVGLLGGWEGAVFWVAGGAVCCEEGQKELKVCVAGGAAIWGAQRASAAGEAAVGGVRAVLVHARTGGLLLDVAAALDCNEQDGAAHVRVPLRNGSLPAIPTPLQLLLLPAIDTQGAVLWSCPLLAGMPPAITSELHSLFPSMLDGQAALDSQHSCKQPGRNCAGENGMPDALSVDLAALEAKVSQEVYLPFISELSLVAWPPSGLAALMPAAAAPNCTPSSNAAASSCADDEQQALTLHMLSFLKANNLDHTLAWVTCMVDHQASALTLDAASTKQQLLPDSTLPQRSDLGSPITWEIPVAADCISPAESFGSACSDPCIAEPNLFSGACTAAAAAPVAAAAAQAKAATTSKLLSKACRKAPLPLSPLRYSPHAILTAVLHHSFPDAQLEYQYQQYQLDSAAALDRQGCLLQLALTIAQLPKATSLCEACILTTTLVGLLVALSPVLLHRRWPSYQWRQRAMLVPQLLAVLPAVMYLVAGWPFPTAYKQMWQRFWLLPLGYFTLLAIWQQTCFVQTAIRSSLYVILYLPLIQLETTALQALAFACLVAGQTSAAAAMEYVQRRAFLRRLQLEGC